MNEERIKQKRRTNITEFDTVGGEWFIPSLTGFNNREVVGSEMGKGFRERIKSNEGEL